MSPASTQQWMRRVRSSDQHIRVSDADRNAVADLLSRHYADGRLDQAEFDERVGRTMAAKTRGDLAGMFDDLPDADAGPDGPSGPGGPAGPPASYGGRRGQRGLVRMVVLVALVLLLANVAWHASMFFIGPLAWAFVIIAAIVVVTRAGRRHH